MRWHCPPHTADLHHHDHILLIPGSEWRRNIFLWDLNGRAGDEPAISDFPTNLINRHRALIRLIRTESECGNICFTSLYAHWGNIATEWSRSRDYALLLFRMIARVLYRAQYHRQYCTLHAFELPMCRSLFEVILTTLLAVLVTWLCNGGLFLTHSLWRWSNINYLSCCPLSLSAQLNN